MLYEVITFRRGVLFLQIGFMNTLDEIDRVVVGDELQCIGDAADEIILA